MNRLLVLCLIMVSLLCGCSSSEKKAAELLDTARFEEKQNNREHAVQLYTEILRSYPSTPAAKDAQARLDALNQKKP